MTPRATYRLQFHKAFTFADAERLAPYLSRLGISHLYASPIAQARAGSPHGYDVVDPTRINEELGGEEGLRALAHALRRVGLGLIIDIVPNHMAVGQADNPWWLDVLEHGERSAHAAFFDIDWRNRDPALDGRVAAPFLGRPYADALKGGDIRLRRGEDAALFAEAHGTHRLPIRPQDRALLLAEGEDALERRYDPLEEEGRERLHALLERQNFRLAWWRTAGDEINWRRFFDIIDLAAIRIERPEVFDTVHALPLRLYREGLIDGVRVDHVDGLADPAGYCRTLRSRLEAAAAERPAGAPGGPAYLVVEKILGRGERLSADWRVDGTTGYDYMNLSSAVLHDEAAGPALAASWAEASGRSGLFADEERLARPEILLRAFEGQLGSAVLAFHDFARSRLDLRDVTAGALRRALIALITCFPVYRSYGGGAVPAAQDAAILARAASEASALMPPGEEHLPETVVGWIEAAGAEDPWALAAARKFQQLTAPIAAKAVEDTAFYRYGRLLSRVDVGFDPGRLGASIHDFHADAKERAERFPAALLATGTHDHKRGEDVRARLAAISQAPDRFIEASFRWRGQVSDGSMHPADLHQLLQTLVGVWPPLLTPDDAAGLEALRTRVAGWQQKALREAKLRSSWSQPDEAYEAACQDVLARLLDPVRSAGFLEDLVGYVDEIAPAGALNALTAGALKCGVPGVPDFYQGSEFWDFSLVDPDNRRPVDFRARAEALESLAGDDRAGLVRDWRDGRIKQAVIAEALALRRRTPDPFAAGEHIPLSTSGPRADNLLAFVRRAGSQAVLLAAPLRCALAPRRGGGLLPSADWWGETRIDALPQGLDLSPVRSGPRAGPDPGDGLLARDLFADWPVFWMSTAAPADGPPS